MILQSQAITFQRHRWSPHRIQEGLVEEVAHQ